MIRFVSWLGLLCLLTACGGAPSPPDAQAPRYEFVDLTDDFIRFWDRTQTFEEGARVAAFKNEFGALARDFYGASRFADTAPERVDERIAKALHYEGEAPFLHHELFHVYHQQFFPECDQVWCGLWTEGLAVYAAQQLNPDASDSQLLLTKPEPIRPQVDAHIEEALCAARTRLSSNESSDMRALFSFQRLSENVPPRAGYYIGYLVAKRAGTSRSVAELARSAPADVRLLLEQSLDTIVVCR